MNVSVFTWTTLGLWACWLSSAWSYAPLLQRTCPVESCEEVALCYDPNLNHELDDGTMLYSGNYLGHLNTISFPVEGDASYGVQPVSSGALKAQVFMGKKPECTTAEKLTNREFLTSYAKLLSRELGDKVLSCDATAWERVEAEEGGETTALCRNQAGQAVYTEEAEPMFSPRRVWYSFEDFDWSMGWEQGWCDANAASLRLCHGNLPGGIATASSGFQPDGSLLLDFSEGIAGELGVDQIEPNARVPSRKKYLSWMNNLAVVEDPEAPEEGAVLRMDALAVQTNGNPDEPFWKAGAGVSVTTTRMFASGSYTVRAKIPAAAGYTVSLMSSWRSGVVYSDQPIPSGCGEWNRGSLNAGEGYSCGKCKDIKPSGGSPFWLDQSEGPGVHVPGLGAQSPAHRVSWTFPSTAAQTNSPRNQGIMKKSHTCDFGSRWWEGVDEERQVSEEKPDTGVKLFAVANQDLIGDGQYHDYRFEWHTGGFDKHGTFQHARVEYYVDGEYLGGNDLLVPVAASRFRIAFTPHETGDPLSTGNVVGKVSAWEVSPGTIRYGYDSRGEKLPRTLKDDFAWYASVMVSRIEIEPFYEEGDVLLPSQVDQPGMNRLVACGSNELSCGTNAVVPLRTANHYPKDADGISQTPCCGAICMEAGIADGHPFTTVDKNGTCPSLVNTVPGGYTNRQDNCECQRQPSDSGGVDVFKDSEYDATCFWANNPEDTPDLPFYCENQAAINFKLDPADPWGNNFGCRYDAYSICILPTLTIDQKHDACDKWAVQNCGPPLDGSYWETAYDEASNHCSLRLRPEWGKAEPSYANYPGLKPKDADASKLPDGQTYKGCTINFQDHPPAYIDTDDSSSEYAGCYWFVDAYCPQLDYDDFDFAVSKIPDADGSFVCALHRRPVKGPPPSGSNPGYRARCDVDYKYYHQPCSANSDCTNWVKEHCDLPYAMFTRCTGGLCMVDISSEEDVKEHQQPIPVCVFENPAPWERRASCDQDYLRYPPCGGTTYEEALTGCNEWVMHHCSSNDNYYTEPAMYADRNGHFRCYILTEWESKAGGSRASCSEQECAALGDLSSPPVLPQPGVSPQPSPLPAVDGAVQVADLPPSPLLPTYYRVSLLYEVTIVGDVQEAVLTRNLKKYFAAVVAMQSLSGAVEVELLRGYTAADEASQSSPTRLRRALANFLQTHKAYSIARVIIGTPDITTRNEVLHFFRGKEADFSEPIRSTVQLSVSLPPMLHGS